MGNHVKESKLAELIEYAVPIKGDIKFWKDHLKNSEVKNPQVRPTDKYVFLGVFLVVKYTPLAYIAYKAIQYCQ